MNYLFYDLETSGLCESFDQIFRFAAIITDNDLNEIDRHEISIKLRPDVVPSPIALAITRLSIEDINQGVCEHEALIRIHKLLNLPNQINLGYNSLNFDNIMLRFGFFRNLLDPYAHQYKNNTYRADVMNINLMYYLYKSDVLSWGNISPMKLENINHYNSLFEGKSHDAMVDVEVTLELSKKLMHHDKRMWDYLIQGFIKKYDKSRLEKLPSIKIGSSEYSIGIYTDIKLGYSNKCCCVALNIGRHSVYNNQTLWMKIDTPNISESFENQDVTLRILRRKDGEPNFIVPWEKSYNHIFSDEKNQDVKSNISWLQNNPEEFNSFIYDKKESKYEIQEELDLDSSIYDGGIFQGREQSDIRSFHSASIKDKMTLLESFQSTRVQEIGKRILFRNYPEYISEDLKHSMMHSIIHPNSLNIRGESRRTPEDAIDEANDFINKEDIDDEQKKIISDYVSFLQSNKS